MNLFQINSSLKKKLLKQQIKPHEDQRKTDCKIYLISINKTDTLILISFLVFSSFIRRKKKKRKTNKRIKKKLPVKKIGPIITLNIGRDKPMLFVLCRQINKKTRKRDIGKSKNLF